MDQPVVVALIFSALSLAVACGALFWQMYEWRMSGGRVKVRLGLAEIVPYAGTSALVTHEGRARVTREDLDCHFPDSQLGPGMEVARVVVENRGRLSLSLTGVGLVLEGTTVDSYSVTPRIFPLKGGHGLGEGSAETSQRLEPYSRVTFLMDIWSVVDKHRRDATKPLLVRAYAQVAGRDKRALSQGCWTFDPGEVSSRRDSLKVPVRDLVLREVMRQGWGDDTFRHPLDNSFAAKAAAKMKPGMDPSAIEEVLIAEAEGFVLKGEVAPMGWAAYQLHERFTTEPSSIGWPADV